MGSLTEINLFLLLLIIMTRPATASTIRPRKEISATMLMTIIMLKKKAANMLEKDCVLYDKQFITCSFLPSAINLSVIINTFFYFVNILCKDISFFLQKTH